jgi:hypothetical protein
MEMQRFILNTTAKERECAAKRQLEDAGGSRTHYEGFANLSLDRLGTAPCNLSKTIKSNRLLKK